jgi:hypothetical protein
MFGTEYEVENEWQKIFKKKIPQIDSKYERSGLQLKA